MTAQSYLNIKWLVTVNFFCSVTLLVIGGLLSLSDYSLFEFDDVLYGELVGNFRFSMVYMGMTEIVICTYCYFTRRFRVLIFVGFFLLTMMGSLRSYGDSNDVGFDSDLPLFFLYNGISHILFGAVASTVKVK